MNKSVFWQKFPILAVQLMCKSIEIILKQHCSAPCRMKAEGGGKGQDSKAFVIKKGIMIIHNPSKFMARLERFELPTYRFVACCSIQLSYSRIRGS